MFWISLSLGRSIASACNDIDVLPAPDDTETLQFQIFVGHALTGPEIVLVAVPWADKMDLIVREFLADPAAVGADDILDLVHDQSFAGRPALVHAQIFIGKKFALPVENADLAGSMPDDPPLAFGELRNFRNEHFLHGMFQRAHDYDTDPWGAATNAAFAEIGRRVAISRIAGSPRTPQDSFSESPDMPDSSTILAATAGAFLLA